jgi:hypothetical protein
VSPVTQSWIGATRFAWRLARNLLCVLPVSRGLLFPKDALSSSFGPMDFGYAWSVFLRHRDRLQAFGFTKANRVLEVGPGRNLGSALLWWASSAQEKERGGPSVSLWDVYPNAELARQDVWMLWAGGLLKTMPSQQALAAASVARLERIARGECAPDIRYEVCSLNELRLRFKPRHFDLIYSQAALEHAWAIGETWAALASLTADSGWHSHRIDLADHGRRDTNYIEMLEWSALSYWLTMRFVPGATNRWRAGEHVAFLARTGFEVLCAERELRGALPVARSRLAREFREMDDAELRTTAVDIVARRDGLPTTARVSDGDDA